MEKHIGRKLSIFEVVHHKDGNPENNNINNLVIMTPEDHISLHHAGRRKGEKLKLPVTEEKKIRFNYNEHTKIISIKNYKPGITIQYGRSTLTAIYSCPLINGHKQVHLLEGNTIDNINARIDEIKQDIKKRLTDTLTGFSSQFNLSLPFKKPSWVRHENWIKGDEFIDRIPRECIIHDTVGKKVYAEGWEFTGGKGQEPTAYIKNYIKNRAIEDIAPDLAESFNQLCLRLDSIENKSLKADDKILDMMNNRMKVDTELAINISTHNRVFSKLDRLLSTKLEGPPKKKIKDKKLGLWLD